MEKTFRDSVGKKIWFSTDYHPFSDQPQHVIVILHYKTGWIMTNHSKRGLEFPGGKKEEGESIKQTAIRETWEETGAVISNLSYIAQYRFFMDGQECVKDVYFAEADALQEKEDYLETKGAVVIEQLPQHFMGEEFSFIMQDTVMKECLDIVKGLYVREG
ncbi:RNA deprotection pyrophosphohydrolase [Bacillus testis]|uniref:RNA deprotection pyrophosphohydrolase n=1 Tax=Bacillus testis TaxID=1622072 RepID=UPI00067E6CF0|nr:nucleoside triphosphatase YtkD [Bacillus testis]